MEEEGDVEDEVGGDDEDDDEDDEDEKCAAKGANLKECAVDVEQKGAT